MSALPINVFHLSRLLPVGLLVISLPMGCGPTTSYKTGPTAPALGRGPRYARHHWGCLQAVVHPLHVAHAACWVGRGIWERHGIGRIQCILAIARDCRTGV